VSNSVWKTVGAILSTGEARAHQLNSLKCHTK